MPDLNDSAQQLREYNDVFLECRDLRHSWTVVGYYRVGPAITRTLVCGRCEMERIDHWSMRGARQPARYKPPKDYYLAGGVDAVQVRQTVLDRVVIYDSPEDMMASVFARPKRRTAASAPTRTATKVRDITHGRRRKARAS